MYESNPKPLVSVIVAVYNVEKYICKCIDSLLEQSYPNFEVILIDDGSTDSSGKICDEYATKDSRIKVVHQSNGGVSAARQTGIDTATGEYTIHADPDDWVEANMLEEMMIVALRDNADMVICDLWREKKGKTYYNCQNPGENPTAEIALRALLQNQLYGSCCNKLVKRSCYNGIGFYPATITLTEDLLFNVRVLAQGIKVSYLSKAFYHYRHARSTSLVNAISEQSIHSMVNAINEIEEVLIHSGKKEAYNTYSLKKTCLDMALYSSCLRLLTISFPEIHDRVINEGLTYHWRCPISGCLSIALRGYPLVAYVIFRINMTLINFCQMIKRLIYLQKERHYK